MNLSREPTPSKQRKAASGGCTGLTSRSRRGRRAGHVHRGLPRNLGGPDVSMTPDRLGKPENNPGSRRMGARPPWERKTGGDGTAVAKETKLGRRNVRESERLVLPRKQGNAPERTLWREGGAGAWNRRRETRWGHGAPSSVSTELRRIAVLAPSQRRREEVVCSRRNHATKSRMRECRTSGSVGAPGEQSPGATRPLFGHARRGSAGDPA